MKYVIAPEALGLALRHEPALRRVTGPRGTVFFHGSKRTNRLERERLRHDADRQVARRNFVLVGGERAAIQA
jgi:hypothetical protein